MELYLFRHSVWLERYTCSYLTQEEWDEKRVIRVPHGIASLVFATVTLVLYIPCLMILRQRAFMQNTCYKIMFYLGIVDIISSIVDGFISGYLFIIGAVFCTHPHFIYITGTWAFSIWCVQCGLCLLLAVNRFLDTCIGKNIAAFLFDGYRTDIWCALCAIYGIGMTFFSPPLLFTSIGGTWFYDPYFGYDEITQVDRTWYFNIMMGINNIGIVLLLFLLYTGMLFKIVTQSLHSGGGVRIQKTIFCQAGFICLVNTIPAMVYLFMQFIATPGWLITIGHYAWQGSNGGPAIIYIFFNKTIQRSVLSMIGINSMSYLEDVCKLGEAYSNNMPMVVATGVKFAMRIAGCIAFTVVYHHEVRTACVILTGC